MNIDERLVIVGGGPAGLATARAYREADGRGRVALVSAEPHPPYNRPPLTKEYLRGEIGRDELPLQSPLWYERNGIELLLQTQVAGIDRDRGVAETVGGQEIPFDACVLATGSEPVRIPVPGADDPEIPVMRTVDDAVRLRARVGEGRRATVVGSGFIGCEAAASLSLAGVEVTLITLEELPQEDRLGRDVGERIRGWLAGYGVQLRLGESLEGIERGANGYKVYIESGDAFETETLLFGTGISPRVRLAEDAGLEVERGVITDSSLRTSASGLFAAGDIAQAYNESAGRHLSVEHWGDALEHGRIAGTVIAGRAAEWSMAPGFWTTIGDKTLKYWAWGDGWDGVHFENRGDSFVARYAKDGVLVGIVAHGADEDYEVGRGLIESGSLLTV